MVWWFACWYAWRTSWCVSVLTWTQIIFYNLFQFIISAWLEFQFSLVDVGFHFVCVRPNLLRLWYKKLMMMIELLKFFLRYVSGLQICLTGNIEYSQSISLLYPVMQGCSFCLNPSVKRRNFIVSVSWKCVKSWFRLRLNQMSRSQTLRSRLQTSVQ